MKSTVLDTNQAFIPTEAAELRNYDFKYTLAQCPLELAVLPLKSNTGTESMRNFVSEIRNKLAISPSSAPVCSTSASHLSTKPTIRFMFWGRFPVLVPPQEDNPAAVKECAIILIFSTAAFTWLLDHYKDNFHIIVKLGFESYQKIRFHGFKLWPSSTVNDVIPRYWTGARFKCPVEFLSSKSELKASLKVEVELKDSIIDLSPFPDYRLLNKEILLNQVQCDFKIIAEDDQVLLCHKAFLASQSTVFAAMFSTVCEETTNNELKLQISREIVDAFLKFLYYSDVEAAMGSPTLAMDLFELGHKYDIVPLELAMKKILLGNRNWWYSADNALRLFEWGCRVKEHEDLKDKAMDVMKSKSQERVESDRFQQMFPNHVGAELAISWLQSSCVQK